MNTQQQTDGAFLRFLQAHHLGDALNDVAAQLKELTRACTESGKPGSLTLTLKLKPSGRGAGAPLFVEDEIKLKAPAREPRRSIFFADPQTFALVRDNPQQTQLPLKTVPAEPVVPLTEVVHG